MKIRARVLTYENGETTVHEVEITEQAMARLAEEIARERYGALHFECITLCLLYTSPSPRDRTRSRMPSSA